MSVIPEKELTLQYKQLENASTNDEKRKPSVADGKEVSLFVRNVKNIFQKEPNFIPKQRSPTNHNEGARTLVTDTVKANHKFEIEAYVYMSDDKGFSLPSGVFSKDAQGRFIGQTTKESMVIDPAGPQLDEFFFVGDTEVVFDSETISVVGGQDLVRGDDYEFDYGRGRFRIKPGGTLVDTDTVDKEVILGFTTSINQLTSLGGVSVPTTGSNSGEVELEIDYEFRADPENVAKLIQRMSQLGGPVVMRKNKKPLLGPTGEDGSTAHTIIPKKVEIVEKADKPDEVKVNIEARRASTTG
jgi:hypothetical protein